MTDPAHSAIQLVACSAATALLAAFRGMPRSEALRVMAQLCRDFDREFIKPAELAERPRVVAENASPRLSRRRRKPTLTIAK